MRIAAGGLIVLSAFAADAVRLPEYQRQVFGNGAVLLLAPKHDVPMITARLFIRGGEESDPAGMAGLSAVTAELLRGGTQKRTAEQISNDLDAMGAVFDATVNRQATVLTADFLSKDSDRMIDMLADLFVRPSFPDAEVRKVLARRIDQVKSIKDNPGAAVGVYFEPFYFGASHPYGQPADDVSLGRITRQAIVDYHKKMYAGRNLVVVVSGDFDTKAMSGKLGILRFLGGGEAYAWKQAQAPTHDSTRLLLIDKPDATQTYFMIAQPGASRTSPDRVPLLLVNTLFGGRFTSMLNDELRVNSGLTYGARSEIQRDRLPGANFISTYTKTETTERAIDLALDVLKRLREKGISEDQLASAKAYVKGGFPTQYLETDGQVSFVLGDLEIFSLNRGEIDDLFAAIDAVTVERANQVIQRYYADPNLQFCVVGDASRIQEPVKKYAAKMKVASIREPGFGVPEF